MRVYLVGDKGEQTAFKITTAHVVTDIDFVLDEMLLRFASGKGYTDKFENIKGTLYDIGYNIYFSELEDMSKTAKKLTGESWRRVLATYINRHKEEVITAHKQRKKILREREE
jgi:hypothetical protein